jgi:hypothetical protein
MEEAAPHAVRSGAGAPDKQALASLRWGWGEAYRIGWDAKRGWWAHRRDEIGRDIIASDPDALWTAIVQDYALKPVPRDLPPAPARGTG